MANITTATTTAQANSTPLATLADKASDALFTQAVENVQKAQREANEKLPLMVPPALASLIIHGDARRMATVATVAGKANLEALQFIADSVGGWFKVSFNADKGRGDCKILTSLIASEARDKATKDFTSVESLPQWSDVIDRMAKAKAIKKRLDDAAKETEEFDFFEKLGALVEKFDKMAKESKYDGRMKGYEPAIGARAIAASIAKAEELAKKREEAAWSA